MLLFPRLYWFGRSSSCVSRGLVRRGTGRQPAFSSFAPSTATAHPGRLGLRCSRYQEEKYHREKNFPIILFRF
jgi:hypothetical protein